ncbi:hypothetical protein PsorP6_015741 [Peronosclerospora sorghi]|uniref:Uncharacterized protein n=1 Tax=Peronosclerospora sorghi TaxID=230839 RepID=A0ACC0WQ39_9STRA|nr:hypothetical protein PsorP6_015741 [Peronosclerospora sorghi]
MHKRIDAKKEFVAQRLRGAQFFDIEEISDVSLLFLSRFHLVRKYMKTTNTKLLCQHLTVLAERFAHAMIYLGVKNENCVIVYGEKNCFRY